MTSGDYLESIARKTASLFEVGARTAAYLAEAPAVTVEAMARCGRHVGLTDVEVENRERVLDDRTRYGHDKTMKRTMVSELKARLSSYLAEVRRGQSVVVCDRATPIARLVPYEPEAEDGFEVRPASLSTNDLKQVRGVRPKRAIDVVRLLREDRDAR